MSFFYVCRGRLWSHGLYCELVSFCIRPFTQLSSWTSFHHHPANSNCRYSLLEPHFLDSRSLIFLIFFLILLENLSCNSILRKVTWKTNILDLCILKNTASWVESQVEFCGSHCSICLLLLLQSIRRGWSFWFPILWICTVFFYPVGNFRIIFLFLKFGNVMNDMLWCVELFKINIWTLSRV